jgi:hypothetical protein
VSIKKIIYTHIVTLGLFIKTQEIKQRNEYAEGFFSLKNAQKTIANIKNYEFKTLGLLFSFYTAMILKQSNH